ncbi:hypothetical protein [Paraburkholderia elongata]|uniref:Uncharacterized protein n=1 Tax=Paraburkholderia elongata TaxID=2675747 RepID=A0A972NZN6_9BURK|nr:hypothetical protein [Paraburkholderia elongata]NPT61867.1 hypothetical protein [Paraburkholderia elongata]
MARTSVAERLAKTLQLAGVKRIWGATDDSLNPIVGRVIGMIAGAAVAVDQYNQTIVHALKDSSDQIVTFQSFDPQRAATQRSVTVARKSYDLESTGFKSVLADYLSVLTAETQLPRAQHDAAAKTIREAAR